MNGQNEIGYWEIYRDGAKMVAGVITRAKNAGLDFDDAIMLVNTALETMERMSKKVEV